jgi:predicted nucleic acid-binding protein
VSVRHPDDIWVLASAMAETADVLVTGDHGLLALLEVIS